MTTPTPPIESPVRQFAETITALPLSQRSGRFALRFRLQGAVHPGELKFIMTPPRSVEQAPRVVSGWTPTIGVRDLIPSGTTTASGVYYLRETSFTNRADAVPSPNVKPTSDITYDGHVSPVATIAHVTKISEQLMDDAPALASQLNTRLLFFLKVAEDKELLYGIGSAGHTDGLLGNAVATTGVTGPVAVAALMDAIGKGIVEINTAGYVTTGIVLNPGDWAGILQTKTAGIYTIVEPNEYIGPKLWGYPVVATPSMTAGQFLVGDFVRGAQVFDREDASIYLSNQNQNDFIKNLMTVLAEERLAQAVYQPGAFRKAG